MSSRPQSTTSASSACTPPVGVSCWLCLEEGPDDESGAPLVRDCSCRGHSGFAHLPCLVKYAERKSKDLIEKGMCKITDMLQEKIFEQCPNCKQAFQGNLYYDLTKAQLSFVERDFKDLQGWYLGTLIRRIAVVDGGDEGDRAEGEEICAKMLSLIDDMKKMSDPSLCSAVLANVYQYIGLFNFKVGTHRCLEKAKYYMEKARDAISTSGDREGQSLPAAFESMIDTIEAILRGESPTQNTASDLINLRERYNFLLRFIGEGSVDTIETFAKGA